MTWMTPEKAKAAVELINQIEALEKVLTVLGADDVTEITIKRQSTGTHYIQSTAVRKMRGCLEEAINRQRLALKNELAQHYNVREAA